MPFLHQLGYSKNFKKTLATGRASDFENFSSAKNETLFLLFRTNQKSSNQLEPTFFHEKHLEAFGKESKKGFLRQCTFGLEP